MDDAVRKEVLRALIDGLPADERLVIEGIFFENVGMQTLAGRMSCDKWTVRRIRNRAYKRLADQLEGLEAGIETSDFIGLEER